MTIVIAIIALVILASTPVGWIVGICIILPLFLVYWLFTNGIAQIRTMLSAAYTTTVRVGGYEKTLVVVYPNPRAWFEFSFQERSLESMLRDIDNPLPADEVQEILTLKHVRLWLGIRGATKLLLPNKNDKGWLHAKLGKLSGSDKFFRTFAHTKGMTAVIRVTNTIHIEEQVD